VRRPARPARYLFALLTYPALTLLAAYPNLWTLAVIGLLLVAYSDPETAALGELFPTRAINRRGGALESFGCSRA
jgi:hypothetical protein